MSRPAPTIEQIQKWADEAAAKWASEHASEDKVRAVIEKRLDRRMEEIVGKLLGFDTRWGREWEVDHCNGRGGESAAGDFLRKRAAESVEAWLEKAAGALPEPSPAIRKAMRAAFEHAVRDAACEEAARIGRERGQELAAKALAEKTEEAK